MSDSWSSKLVMNKSVHKHRAEIARPISPVFHRTFGRGVYSLDARKIRYLSRETREGEENEGEKRKEEESRSAMRSWNLVIHSELEVRF